MTKREIVIQANQKVNSKAINKLDNQWENNDYGNMMLDYCCQTVMNTITKTFELDENTLMFDNEKLEDAMHVMNDAISNVINLAVDYEENTVVLPKKHGTMFTLADDMGNRYNWITTDLGGYVNLVSGTYYEPDAMEENIEQNNLHLVK